MPTETLIACNQLGYYTALHESQQPAIDGAPFITFMLGVIEASLVDYQASVGANVEVDARVLDMVRQTPHVSAVRLAEQLGVSSRQVERVIKGWRDKGVLIREGSPRSGHWVVTPQAGARRDLDMALPGAVVCQGNYDTVR